MRAIFVSIAFVVFLISPCVSSLAQSDVSPEYRADVKLLMESIGAKVIWTQMADQLLGPMQQAMPNVSPEFWERFKAKVDAAEIVDMIIPVYAKYYTHDEIRQLLAFYQTPVGKKLVATMPAVMQESMAIGQQWGQQLGAQVEEELKAEGYR